VSLRDEILAIDDSQIEELYIPEWSKTVHIRVMRAGERDTFEAECLNTQNKVNFRAKLASLVVCDEQGERVFQDADVDALASKSASALDRIFRHAIRLNAMTQDDVKELEGN